MRFGVSNPSLLLTRRRRRLSALTLSERAVAAKLHPRTGLVTSFNPSPPEVRHAADPDDRRGGPAAP